MYAAADISGHLLGGSVVSSQHEQRNRDVVGPGSHPNVFNLLLTSNMRPNQVPYHLVAELPQGLRAVEFEGHHPHG